GNGESRPLFALGLARVFATFGLLQHGVGPRTRIVWFPGAVVNADRVGLTLAAPFIPDDVSLAAVGGDANAKSPKLVVPQTNARHLIGRTFQSLDCAHANARMYCLLFHVPRSDFDTV